MKQLEILKERCELYIQRENNMNQITNYIDGLHTHWHDVTHSIEKRSIPSSK